MDENFDGDDLSRAIANRMTGYNGSLKPYVREVHESQPCPADIKARIAAARAVLEKKAVAQKLKGQCI